MVTPEKFAELNCTVAVVYTYFGRVCLPVEVFETEWSLSDLLCLNVYLVVRGCSYTGGQWRTWCVHRTSHSDHSQHTHTDSHVSGMYMLQDQHTFARFSNI